MNRQASFSPCGLARTQQLLERSRKLLQLTWDHPDQVGLGSQLLRLCETHSRIVRRYATPQLQTNSSAAREAFLEALKLSWLATWMARDYSQQGWLKRFSAQDRGRLWQHVVGVIGQRVAERNWSPLHRPAFDRDGKFIEVNSSIGAEYNADWASSYLEGAQLANASVAKTLFSGRSITPLHWSFVQDRVLEHLPSGWDLSFGLIESLDQNYQGQGGRKHRLVNSIILGVTKLEQVGQLNDFQGARFEGGLELRNSRIRAELAEFPTDIETGIGIEMQSVTFQGGLQISPANGVRRIKLIGSTIVKDLAFRSGGVLPSFELSGSGASVNGLIDGTNATFSDFVIHAQSINSVELSAAVFRGQVSFAGTNVRQDANFYDACFQRQGETAGRPAILDFSSITVGGNINFDRAQFLDSSPIKFFNAQFHRATFRGATFGGPLDFRLTAQRFGPVDFSADGIRATFFERGVDFSCGNGAPPFDKVAFKGAVFRGDVSFVNRKFGDTAEFDRATFEQVPKFYGSVWHPDTSFRAVQIGWARGLKSNWFQRTMLGRSIAKIFKRSEILRIIAEDDDYLGRSERALREMAKEAERIHARTQAAMFHKSELKARHMRSIDPDVSRSEAWMGRAYELLSDYGDSIARPPTALLVVFAMWTVFYFFLSGAYPDNFLPAASISLAATFKPWAALDSSIARAAAEWDGHCQNMALALRNGFRVVQNDYCLAVQLTHSRGLLFQTMVMIQSISSIVLIFLFLLAVRRKFQLS